MGDSPDSKIRAVLVKGIDSGVLCGAVYAISSGTGDDTVRLTEAIGRLEPGAGAPVRPDTIFDLASLTKVVATLPVILCLVSSGEVGLDDPVRRYLPRFSAQSQRAVTVRHLLAHTSGLPPGSRYYRSLPTAEAARDAILAEEPVRPPGASVTYSDVGYLLLGFLAERVGGTSLDVLARRLVFEPLAMTETGFRPTAPIHRIAPTEVFPPEPARRGVVHDRNAALLDGVAGHAGLFAPAADMLRYLGAWSGQYEPPWAPSLTREALTRQTPADSGARGLGWVLASGTNDTFMSERWPPGGAGHTGFTGTSLAFSPQGTKRAVLLTNAVRCGRQPERLGLIRQDFHRLIGGEGLL